MSKLITLNNLTDDQLLNEIFDNDIIIFEDIQGSKIFCQFASDSIIIKPKSLNSDPLNIVDLAIQNYYGKAFDYLNNLDGRVKNLLNKNWWFVFEYFPDEFPANIEYNKIPKNNLILTSIIKNNKFIYNIDEIDEYSRLLNIDAIPVIFKGKLSETTKEAIKYFLNTSEQDLEYVFGEKSFSYFFYKLLNPLVNNSFLMKDNFQKNIEKLIIRIKDKDLNFELLNPLYQRISLDNSTDFLEIFSLIIVNFLDFCQSVDFNDIKIKGDTKDQCYIYLICKLFNMYVSESKDDLINFDFQIPEFFDKDKFKVNSNLIINKLTKEYIENPKLEYIFKIILSSFNKKRKKPIGIFTEQTLICFNEFINNLNEFIDRFLKKKPETELIKKGLVDFSKWVDFHVDKDAEQQVYPQIWDEIEKNNREKDKKDKKGKKSGEVPSSKEFPTTKTKF